MTPEPTVAQVDVEAAPLEVSNGQDDGPRLGDAENDNGSLPLLLTFVGVIIAIGFLKSWWIPGIVAGLLFMLFMHELGHYVTARMSGMKVSEFFLGFGPKIWSFNRGETEYGVKAIPAGAYVRILGMTNLEDVDPAEEHRTYRAQPYWQRMMTICAGSAMHFAMAFIGLIVLFSSYGYQGFNGPPWEVDLVVPGSTADALGIELGDRVVEIAGEDIATWLEFGEVISAADVGPIEVVVQRGDDRIRLNGDLGARSGDVVTRGFGLVVNQDQANQGWVVEHVRDGSAAAGLGMDEEDIVVRAGTMDEPTQAELGQWLVATEGDSIEILVRRDSGEELLTGVVALDRSEPFRGFFGVRRTWRDKPPPGFGGSIGLAASDFGTSLKANTVGLARALNPAQLVDGLFGADDAPQELRAGPPTDASVEVPADSCVPQEDRLLSFIGFARVVACSDSADEVIFLFVAINIFIGIFNLVPMLPVDGGHAALATYEKVRSVITRRPYRVDASKLIPLTWAVIVLLVGIGLWTAILDTFAWPT